MRQRFCINISVILITIATVSSAQAMSLSLDRSLTRHLPIGGHLSDGSFTQSPRAFQNFCGEYASECIVHGSDETIHLNDERYTVLEAINGQVNRSITPQPALLGASRYMLGVSEGNCNEYAVAKRHRLLELGWSTSSLSLAVVRLPSGEGHLVLTARTDHGDLVLDNLNEHVIPADRTNYTWIERQSTVHPRLWVSMNGGITKDATRLSDSNRADALTIAWSDTKIQPNPSLMISKPKVRRQTLRNPLQAARSADQREEAVADLGPDLRALYTLQSGFSLFGNMAISAWEAPIQASLAELAQMASQQRTGRLIVSSLD